jgi:hypothetical protein
VSDSNAPHWLRGYRRDTRSARPYRSLSVGKPAPHHGRWSLTKRLRDRKGRSNAAPKSRERQLSESGWRSGLYEKLRNEAFQLLVGEVLAALVAPVEAHQLEQNSQPSYCSPFGYWIHLEIQSGSRMQAARVPPPVRNRLDYQRLA